MIIRKNNLIVIENGHLSTYLLDDKLEWSIGRISKDNCPDIELHAPTISRKHGKFRNVNSIWFYYDGNGKNGTIHNKKPVKPGINKRTKAIMLNPGDILILGCGETENINYKTVWTRYSDKYFDEVWNVVDTKGYEEISFISGNQITNYNKPAKGTVVESDSGMAIYMGDVTYVVGDMKVKNN